MHHYELDDYLTQHPALPASLTWGHAARALLPVGIGSMLHYQMQARDGDLATTFFHGLTQGLGLTAADPVWHVRERFLKDKSPLHHNAILDRGALTVLAWKGLSDRSVPFPSVL